MTVIVNISAATPFWYSNASDFQPYSLKLFLATPVYSIVVKDQDL